MQLRLTRKRFGESTIGRLSVDGEFECYTLEDKVREIPGLIVEDWKIPGKTAIPVGTYEVVLSLSARFGKILPLLLNVAGFSGVRIHSGNKAEDTEGCILVGQATGENRITQSRAAMSTLQPKIEKAIASGERVFLTVEGLPDGVTTIL